MSIFFEISPDGYAPLEPGKSCAHEGCLPVGRGYTTKIHGHAIFRTRIINETDGSWYADGYLGNNQ